MEPWPDFLYVIGAVAIGGAVVGFGPRGWSLFRALISGWSRDNIAARLAICKACPRVKARVYVDGAGKSSEYLYCDECKCGSHHLAELNVKLGFNNIKCPLDKWGPKQAMTVHEAHDMLIERGNKERSVDKQERTNIMAGRDRNDNGPTNGTPLPITGDRTAQAAELQRQSKVKQERQLAHMRKERADQLSQQASGPVTVATNTDTKAQDTSFFRDTQTPALAGVDHEDEILVDQEKHDG